MPSLSRRLLLLLLLTLGGDSGYVSTVGAACLKFRATKQCDPNGVRQSSADRSCASTIPSGISGYCECEIRKYAMMVSCEHLPFNCNDACARDHNVHLTLPDHAHTVTYGSILRLVHESSRYRLHSHAIEYAGGSGQQSVTAHGSQDETNGLWLIKEGHEAPLVPSRGSVVRCDDVIRLEHVNTQRNLHSHNFKSALTKQIEVSAFGSDGLGDSGDSWTVLCEESCNANDGDCEAVWKREELIRLRNKATGGYLWSSSKARFDNSNCPGCPINGQQEVSSSIKSNENSWWFAGEGMYMLPSQEK